MFPKDIVDKSGVIQVQILGGDENAVTPVAFVFTGTRSAIGMAKFLVEYHVRNTKEVDNLRGDVDDLEIYPRGAARYERANDAPSGAHQQHGYRGKYGNGRRTHDDEDDDHSPSQYVSRRGGRGKPKQ